MSGGIPVDSNFKKISCQLGGLRMNGIVDNSTALSDTVLTIDDGDCIQQFTPPLSSISGYLRVKIEGTDYYLPLYTNTPL